MSISYRDWPSHDILHTMEPPTYPGLELLDFRYVTWARRTVLQHWYRIKTIDKYLFLEDISGEDASKDHIDLDVFVIGTVLNSFEDETKHTTADVTSCPCRESVNLFMTYGPPESKSDHWPWPLAEKHWVEAYRVYVLTMSLVSRFAYEDPVEMGVFWPRRAIIGLDGDGIPNGTSFAMFRLERVAFQLLTKYR